VGRITLEMTVLEVICQYRQTEQIFRKYDAVAGVCLCCQALFDSLADLTRKYGLDPDALLADLEGSLAQMEYNTWCRAPARTNQGG
jgi:hypothetical protein